MDQLGPLQSDGLGRTLILVLTDQFMKMKRCISARSTTVATVTTGFLKYGFYAYSAHQYILIENEKQLVHKILGFVYEIMESKDYHSAAYHLQTNTQTKQLSRATVRLLMHHVTDHKTD